MFFSTIAHPLSINLAAIRKKGGWYRVGPAETPTEQILDVFLALPLTIALFMNGLLIFLAAIHFGDGGLQGVQLKKKLAVEQSKRRQRSHAKNPPSDLKPTGMISPSR